MYTCIQNMTAKSNNANVSQLTPIRVNWTFDRLSNIIALDQWRRPRRKTGQLQTFANLTASTPVSSDTYWYSIANKPIDIWTSISNGSPGNNK